MHEMAVCRALLERVEHHAHALASQTPAVRVLSLRLEIGRLANIEIDALEFCFGAVARGTCAEGATLEIRRTPGRAWCTECAAEVSVESHLDQCPDCGSGMLVPCGGDKMLLKGLEVV
jgi:hydrogenase nickel incorporation protein HypA/HybF